MAMKEGRGTQEGGGDEEVGKKSSDSKKCG